MEGDKFVIGGDPPTRESLHGGSNFHIKIILLWIICERVPGCMRVLITYN